MDSAGAVYVTGAFSGKRDFDPGSGTCNLTSAGKTDAFVAKLSASGGFVWAKRIGGASYDKALSVALDNKGNVLLTGYFSSSVDFDPGSGTTKLSSVGDHDAFIAKLSGAGGFSWRAASAATATAGIGVGVWRATRRATFTSAACSAGARR